MRILVDHSAGVNQGAGIGRYARNVVTQLSREWPEADLTLWYASEPGAGPRFLDAALGMFDGAPPPRTKRAPLDRRRMDQCWFRAQVPIPIELLAGRHDVIYSPDFTAPPSRRTPRVMTIHDLAFMIVPERAPAPLREYLRSVVPSQVRDATAVVTVSETTRRDLAERLMCDPARVTVVPNGVDRRFLTAEPLGEGARARLGLPSQYLLTVGTLEPRKNHLTLFDALEAMGGDVPPLVVAGRVGWDAEAIVKRGKELRQRGRVILLDYVPEDLLPGLYAGASAVIYVSWYEGFGLPVLEALAAGVPVVASDVPALREVGNDLPVYVPPADPEAIADGIGRVLRSEPADARARRRAHAGTYDWETAGRALADVLREVGQA